MGRVSSPLQFTILSRARCHPRPSQMRRMRLREAVYSLVIPSNQYLMFILCPNGKAQNHFPPTPMQDWAFQNISY
jgi:hypothetical protein